MRKTWGIIWRIFWVLTVISIVPDEFKGMLKNSDFLGGLVEFCLMCVVLNIPIYIWAHVQRDNVEQAWDRFIDWFNWEFHPVRTFILELALAPIGTVIFAIMLAIQAIGLITGRYDL